MKGGLIGFLEKYDRWEKIDARRPRPGPFVHEFQGYIYALPPIRFTDEQVLINSFSISKFDPTASEILEKNSAEENAFHYLFSRSTYLLAPQYTSHIRVGKALLVPVESYSPQQFEKMIECLFSKLNEDQIIEALSQADSHGHTPLYYLFRTKMKLPKLLLDKVGRLLGENEDLLCTPDNDRGNLLHFVCREGGQDRALFFLKTFDNYNPGIMLRALQQKNASGQTPYAVAVESLPSKVIDQFNQFIQKHDQTGAVAVLRELDAQGNTPLHIACRAKKMSQVSKVLKGLGREAASVAACINARGWNALHYAARSGDAIIFDKVWKALAGGAPAAALAPANYKKQTPLHLVCQYGTPEMLKQVTQGLSAAQLNKIAHHDSPKDLARLIAKNPRINAVTYQQTVQASTTLIEMFEYLSQRAQQPGDRGDYKNRYNDFRVILNNMVMGDIHITTGVDGSSFLKRNYLLFSGLQRYQDLRNRLGHVWSSADRNRQKRMLVQFKDYLADIKGARLGDASGSIPSDPINLAQELYKAISLGRPSSSAQSEKLKVQDAQGNTPLHVACRAHERDGVSETLNGLGSEAATVAAWSNHRGWNALHYAARSGDAVIFDKVWRALAGGAPAAALAPANYKKQTPLHLVCQYGTPEMLKQVTQGLSAAQLNKIAHHDSPKDLARLIAKNPRINAVTYQQTIHASTVLVEMFEYLSHTAPMCNGQNYKNRYNDFHVILKNMVAGEANITKGVVGHSFIKRNYLLFSGSQRYLDLRNRLIQTWSLAGKDRKEHMLAQFRNYLAEAAGCPVLFIHGEKKMLPPSEPRGVAQRLFYVIMKVGVEHPGAVPPSAVPPSAPSVEEVEAAAQKESIAEESDASSYAIG